MDNFYNIDYQMINKYIKKKNKLNVNYSYSSLYRYKSKLFKIFNNPNTSYDKYQKFCELSIPSFTFPNEIIVNKMNIYGYIMNFIEGKTFNNISLNILLSNFFIAFNEIDKDIYIISKNNIEIMDLHFGNIIYDDKLNKITFLDTDEYSIYNNLSISDLYKKNLIEFRNILIKLFCINNSSYIDYKQVFNIEKSTLEVFKELVSFFENTCDKSINTLEDFKKVKKISKGSIS